MVRFEADRQDDQVARDAASVVQEHRFDLIFALDTGDRGPQLELTTLVQNRRLDELAELGVEGERQEVGQLIDDGDPFPLVEDLVGELDADVAAADDDDSDDTCTAFLSSRRASISFFTAKTPLSPTRESAG